MIYVKFEIPKTKKEFLELFFNSNVPGTQIGAVETFLDEKCTKQQCEAYKKRSFEDMFECINTYFPETEERELVHYLLTITYKQNDNHFSPYFRTCINIKRINFQILSGEEGIFSPVFKDDFSKYNSEKSWKEYFTELEIYTENNLRKYIIKNKNKTYEECWIKETA